MDAEEDVRGERHPGAGVASALTGAAALFVLLRLLAVSGYDWHTAFALLHTLDFEDAPAIFLGTFMANRVISSVLLVALIPFTILAYAGARRARDHRAWAGPGLLVVVLVAMVVAHVRSYRSWGLLIAIVVLGVVLTLVERTRDHPRFGGPVRWVLRSSRSLAVVGALVCAAVVSTPWVPLERIETTTGIDDFHVFDVSPGFLKVLTADTHEFRIFRDDEIRHRVELTDH
ncbi:hypothetical protein UO65_0646 [Actinokineospora spheciospongiae]|uniref:Uncharacterized protein n=1 Tax=Actinokineospora spheciospongiae TaxID=909613 RepID=W7ISY6_9PSEU|nr:hypothetical protein [Actinokineospora spheciospongiae]EWC64025.1 hypothetical protein UO65_0646 [Actinokineospora spheciospongiae]PWW56871.1 hypothetical protein DFQ13_11072 [Actinokineospora spheciospongiae]